MAKRYALVIGISEYTYLNPLPNAIRDAEAIAQLFDQYGDFEDVKRYPTQWLDTDRRYEMKSAAVSADNLWNQIDKFLEAAQGQDAFIFLAAHGLSIKDRNGRRKGYIAASRNTQTLEETVSFEELKIRFAKFQRGSLTIFLDCCHSGLALEQAIARGILQDEFQEKNFENFVMLAACRGHQKAYESGEHSVFANAILDALKPENADQATGRITYLRLADTVTTKLQGSGQEADNLVRGTGTWLLQYPPQQNALDTTPPTDITHEPLAPATKLEDKLRKLNYRKQDNIFTDFLEQDSKVGAFWVRHHEGGGQRWLINRLWREKVPDATNADKFYLEIIRTWQLSTIWQRLARKYGAEADPAAIAEYLYQSWTNGQTVALILYGVERLSAENSQALINQLWQPLSQKARNQDSDYPLLLFLVDTGITDSQICYVEHVCEYDADRPEMVVDLPLDNFRENTLRNWVNTHVSDLLRDGTQEMALQKIIACNQQPQICVKEVLEEICRLCGYSWEEHIESKFAI